MKLVRLASCVAKVSQTVSKPGKPREVLRTGRLVNVAYSNSALRIACTLV
jgi:hypothetical protein